MHVMKEESPCKWEKISIGKLLLAEDLAKEAGFLGIICMPLATILFRYSL
jgi:hypothetical protein